MASALKCLALLKGNYGNRFELNEFTEAAWNVILGDFEEADLLQAAKAWISAGNAFPPDAGQILREVRLAKLPGAAAMRKTAGEAWAEALVGGTLANVVALDASAIEHGDFGTFYRASELDPRKARDQYKRFEKAWGQLQETGYGLERYLAACKPPEQIDRRDAQRLPEHRL